MLACAVVLDLEEPRCRPGCHKPHPPAFHASVPPLAAVVAGGLQRGQLRRALATEVPAAAAQHAARLRHVAIFVVVRAAALRPAQPSSSTKCVSLCVCH